MNSKSLSAYSGRDGESIMNGHDASAFPLPEIPGRHPAEPGMSLWDFFAAAALHGLAAHSALMPNESAEMALRAANAADAMMAERAKRLSSSSGGSNA